MHEYELYSISKIIQLLKGRQIQGLEFIHNQSIQHQMEQLRVKLEDDLMKEEYLEVLLHQIWVHFQPY